MTANLSTRIERALQQQLAAGCAATVFPGASASIAFWRRGAWHYVDVVAGLRAEGGPPVTVDTFYDLASLTKPWVASAALRLHQARVFDLGERVEKLIPEANGLP
ncbi:MAG: serine hydrolase, partial [Polyangiales bacterium]